MPDRPATYAFVPQWLKNRLAFIELRAVETCDAALSDIADRTFDGRPLAPFTVQEIFSDHTAACIAIENVPDSSRAMLNARIVELAAAAGMEIVL